jgi:3-oxoacyl-[acyl-carrier protein] reductase
MKSIIIGGTKGIGASIFNKHPGGRYLAMSRSKGADERWRYIDLRGTDFDIQNSMKLAIQDLDGLDNLVISSGMGAYLGPLQMTHDRILELMQVNVFGPISAYLACRRALVKSRGKVIFISSSVADNGARGLSVYAATKGAINSFVRSEAKTAAKLGYAVCAVAPGWCETPMTAELDQDLRAAILKYIPEGRMARPDEIADFVMALLGQSNWVLQGQIFTATGGY